MSQSDRLYKLHQWLASGRVYARERLLRDLEVSRATLNRDIAKCRYVHNLPIEWDQERNGYFVDLKIAKQANRVELPSLWFTHEEIYALLTMRHLLDQLDVGGMLGAHIQPLTKRIESLLGSASAKPADLAKYIRIASVGTRRVKLPHFETIGSALLNRRRLHITHWARERDQKTERELSPQRLINYRGNWYLDAWCHAREGLRSFAVDAIQSASIAKLAAIDMPEQQLDAALGSGYGIFAGDSVQWAKLRFSPQRSRWVAAESWHPEQRGAWDGAGRWTLELPYADPRELVMDILRHVPDVEVLAPAALGEELATKLRVGMQTVWRSSRGEPSTNEDDGHDIQGAIA